LFYGSLQRFQDQLRSGTIGAAKPLFTTRIRHSIATEAYDVARDGRFLVVDSITESTAPLVLVTNWDAELKK
jgi:hypothetical protein